MSLRYPNLLEGSSTPGGSSGPIEIVDPIDVNPAPFAGQTYASAVTNFPLDAFGRVRIADQATLFDSKLTEDLAPLLWDTATFSGGSVTYVPADACARLTTNGAGQGVIRQTFFRPRYQPGKALRNTEPVLTPSGWRQISELKIGDTVFDGLGQITEVVGVFPQGIRQLYRVRFDDGTEVDADGDHLWKTVVRRGPNAGMTEVLTTLDMIQRHGQVPKYGYQRFRIPAAPVLDLPERELPVDPYTLGVILGDGSVDATGFVTVTNPEAFIRAQIQVDTSDLTSNSSGCPRFGIKGSGQLMRELGLAETKAETKFVPTEFLFGSPAQRLALLQGLMDTDGTVDKRDHCVEFNSASYQLAEAVAFLVRSLGGQAKIRERPAGYRDAEGEWIECLPTFRVRVVSPVNPFRVPSKATRWAPRTRITYDRFIHSITPIDQAEATCIRVASEDHTFLTRNHVVTHNSQLYFITFRAPSAAGVRQRIGCFGTSNASDSVPQNGIFFENNGGTLRFCVAKAGVITEMVDQSSWNLDRLDGTGASGVNLDMDACHILYIDFEWLGVGSVRVGFVINDVIVAAHAFDHANDPAFTSVYMSTPNLPLGYQIYQSGGAAGVLDQICASVASEGGQEELGVTRSINMGATTLQLPSTTSTYAVLAIRLRAGVDTTIIPRLISLVATSNDGFLSALYFNPVVAGTLTWTALANSSIEYAYGASANTLTGGIEMSPAYTSQQSRDVVISTRVFPRLGRSLAAVSDILVVGVRPLGANLNILAALTWDELV